MKQVKPSNASNEHGPLLPVSVIIHTLNEEINLPHALPSVCGRFSEIFVVDAGSTDKTKEIALEHEATFVQISGDRRTLVRQRNWALENLKFKNDWVYILDADESVSDELYAEIAERTKNFEDNIDGYWVRYKDIKFGKWLKRSSLYPNWSMRLFRHAAVRYEDRTVNAHVKINSDRASRLIEHFVHNDRRGFAAYIKRLSSITVIEALSLDEMYSQDNELLQSRLFSGSFIERRRALKKIFYRFPFRPLLLFIYIYFFRLGLLEGKAGLYNSLYRASQELFVNIIRYEAKVTGK